MSQQIANSVRHSEEAWVLLEKVIINNDLAGLSSSEKVLHVKNMCESLGLNPMTKPIQLIRFQGKEVPYFTKDATEQLRKNYKVSITKIETKIVDDVYIVTAYAATPDGRTDSSTGVTTIANLKGEALCNSMMKAETKAKRRVTLSICGLGMLDESELDTMQGAVKVDLPIESKPNVLPFPAEQKAELRDLAADIDMIMFCSTMQELQDCFTPMYKHYIAQKDKISFQKITDAKNAKKEALMQEIVQ